MPGTQHAGVLCPGGLLRFTGICSTRGCNVILATDRWSAVFTIALLLFGKRFSECDRRAADKKKMRYMLPAR
jgi:hypothetical protein